MNIDRSFANYRFALYRANSSAIACVVLVFGLLLATPGVIAPAKTIVSDVAVRSPRTIAEISGVWVGPTPRLNPNIFFFTYDEIELSIRVYTRREREELWDHGRPLGLAVDAAEDGYSAAIELVSSHTGNHRPVPDSSPGRFDYRKNGRSYLRFGPFGDAIEFEVLLVGESLFLRGSAGEATLMKIDMRGGRGTHPAF